MRNSLLLSVLFLLLSCGTSRKPFLDNKAKNWQSTIIQQPTKPIHSLYLIGDTGDTDGQGNYVLQALQQQLERETSASSLVFLGDQIYPAGMPKKRSPKRPQAERILQEQLAILKNYTGNTYFIAGEKDWNAGEAKGLKALKRQEAFIENYYPTDKKVKLYPGQGCADPKVVKINKDLIFVFLDTQWWLQDWADEKKINQGCDIQSKYDLLKSVEEIFAEHKNDEVVVLMHHPIHSNGNHGGRFSLKDHLFPFQETNNINIPLPLIGSLVPVARNISGTKQDITNAQYQELMFGIEAIAKKLKMYVLFAAAHDNGLQHFDKDKLQYVVSGSGSRTHYIGKEGGASFAQAARGFSKVLFYKENETWLELYTVAGPDQQAALAYKAQIRVPRPGTVPESKQYPPVSIQDTTLAANANFKAGNFKNLFLGKQYRTTWATPVKAPVIDLEKKLGGLTPIKKGGGMASNSLRMQTPSGQQYILRSINKDYRKLVPPAFANLKLLDIMKDQNSASHPYGALIIPALSEAAGIFYTNPKLVYLKHQRGLGNYNSQFPEELYLLEERPSDDWSDAAQFGNSSKIIGYTDLLTILREKKNHFVDQQWVCKSRLFDLLIHDWDRHDDQWRWASFEEDDKTIYRPIPRDRDQAFYKFVGIVPTYIAAFMLKQFKTMKADLKDVRHLAFNAKHFDRYFMNELEWSDWQETIKELQQNLTDEAIEQSVHLFPAETRSLTDKELIFKLKSRRNQLVKIGKKLYTLLAQEVDISGTDNEDTFELTRHTDGSVQVKMYVERNSKERLLKYERTFYPKETKEIRLYGLRGKDQFTIKGAASTAIAIRVVGGEEADQVLNETKGGKITVYDAPTGMELQGAKLKDQRSDEIEANEYDRNGFTYNTSLPTFTFGSTPDDGFFIGGSYSWTTHAWRKTPYKSTQKIALGVAPAGRNVLDLAYTGHFPKAVGAFDFAPSLHIDSPHYENYFGLGNESINPLIERRFHWVRLQSLTVSPLLSINNQAGTTQFLFGPTYESHDVKRTTGRVSTDAQLGFSEEEFERTDFLGGTVQFQTGFIDNGVFPSNGVQFGSELSYLHNFKEAVPVWNWTTDLQFYVSLVTNPKVVLANNIGYQKVIGTPQFYQTADLGTTTNLRGYRNNRFRGESAFYHNIDVRMHLFRWNNNWLPMTVGVLGGYDYGRVWLEGEESEAWHTSQTVGLWMNILGVAVLQPYYSFTEEEDVFSLKLGFNF